MDKIPNPPMVNSKQFCERFDEIEWRTKGTYCQECGRDFKYPFDPKHIEVGLDGITIFWACVPGEECRSWN